MTLTWKKCRRCAKPKLSTQYYNRHATCKECRLLEMKKRYHANKPPLKPRTKMSPEEYKSRRRDLAFQRRYGITEAERDAMLAAQGGVCEICKRDNPSGYGWATDHDHACCPTKDKSCGKCIRGILCSNCNTLLGHARDDVKTLASAIDYLNTRRVTSGA